VSPKKVTSQMVAERAGVSRTTVSFVLNKVEGIQISEETRLRVLKAARDLGYVPNASAQALVGQRTKIIGLVLTRSPSHITSDAFLTQVLNGLMEVTRRHKMRLLLEVVEDLHHREAYMELAWSKRIDGILLSGPRFDDEALHALEEDGFPAVLLGQLPGSSFPSVDVDNTAAAEKAVAHLVRLGHRRIACITHAQPQYTTTNQRLEGYHKALAAAGIPYDEELVRYGDFSPESGYQEMVSLLAGDKHIDAVFAASDVVAMGVMGAIREAGLSIPGDIAVVGFDDVPMARYVDPPLTTIHLPAIELARTAGEMIIPLTDGHQPEKTHVVLDTELVVRKSSGS
jgi:DNA-binding LacI/PurR family transcriptional regulator